LPFFFESNSFRIIGHVKLAPDVIDELKKIYRAEYHAEITDAEAEEIGLRLLRLARIVCQPRSMAHPTEPVTDVVHSRF
jgi:uncharacterized hydantoinase/oxoprolinase family protein